MMLNGMALAGRAAVVALVVSAGAAQAQDAAQTGERYEPAIWIDPDGCEHWVMDDGAEGFMSPHLTRQGLPVCHEQNLCGTVQGDQTFGTDSAQISTANRKSLREFFENSDAVAYTIVGHTDDRASHDYNMDLSQRRANAVASVARDAGARLSDVRGHAAQFPKATNETADGRAQNRRVEILCWR